MDSQRLVRHTFAGIVFTFYLLVFYFLFDGKLNLTVLSVINSEAFYLPIASLLLTTPVIGLIISTLSVAFQHLFDGYRVHYGKLSELLIDHTLRNHQAFKAYYNANVNNKNGRRRRIRWMYYHYMVLRQDIKDDSLKFLERRWNIYWVHSNIFIAIIVAYIIAVTIQMVAFYSHVEKETVPPPVYWQPPTYIIIITLMITAFYALAAAFQIRNVRREAIVIEKLILENRIHNPPQVNNNGLR